jgi:arsenite methyltransferase
MSTLTFADDMARLQRALAQCHDMVVRRTAVLDALRLRSRERVLEVGCGGGVYAYEAAQCVGPAGRVCALDLSADQVASAKARCAELAWVECQVADAVKLPYGDAEFDALYGVQVFEYVVNLDEALREIPRVLRPGGRVLILATNWSSLVWHSDQAARMKRVLSAFAAHAAYPDLHAHAVAVGAAVVSAPTTYPFGERQYSAVDVGGHRWTFSQSVADIDPASWGGELVQR